MTDFGIAVSFLRRLRGWSRERLARAAGMDVASIARYEQGGNPRRKTADQIRQAIGLSPASWRRLFHLIGDLRREMAAASPAVSAPADAGGPEPMEDLLAALGPRVSGALASLSAPVESPPPQVPTTADRHRADRLWARFRPLSPAARRALVGEGEEFLTWEMAERLSLESEKIADTRAEEALALAELADRIAERVSLPPKFGSLLRSLTTASLGHARRSAGLPYADAFRRSDELWRSGAGGDPAELLDGKRRIRLRSAVAAPP